MNRRMLLVSGSVALLCGAILVLFTDIEDSFAEWINCGPLAPAVERESGICR